MVLLKIKVNEIVYDIKHVGEKVWVNNKEVMLKLRTAQLDLIEWRIHMLDRSMDV